jgi:DNA polymerase-1
VTSVIDALPFREVWALDFEFLSPPGERQDPVCMVAHELRSGRELELWLDGWPTRPPFSVDRDTLFVGYFSSAEWRCFNSLGWPFPSRVIDLYAEYMLLTSGRPHKRPLGKKSLLSALAAFGVKAITSDEKDEGRRLVMRGPPWTDHERRVILDYCATDVVCLGPLLERMLPLFLQRKRGLEHAVLRGRYTTAVARMEDTGTPVDIDTLQRLRERWEPLKLLFIESIDKDYGVYDGTTFRNNRFLAWARHEGIRWPSNEAGTAPSLTDNTFKDMAKAYPQVAPLRELRHTLSDLRLERLEIGSDSRNRTLLSPWGAATGRNAPSTNKSIWGASVWVRSLIQPREGQALVYVDWSAQEVAIAAALSGDGALLDSVHSGDPYLSFAVRAGLAPEGATKATHKTVRDQCKACVLGINYGMGPVTLAYRIGGDQAQAHRLMTAHRRAFPVFWRWVDDTIGRATVSKRIHTGFGWSRHVGSKVAPTVIQNFPIQATGAEMLRLACCFVTEAGINVCAPVHDALCVEAPDEELEEVVEATRSAMARASRIVLGGVEVATDAEMVRWPNRYADARGRLMWSRAMEGLARLEGETV